MRCVECGAIDTRITNNLRLVDGTRKYRQCLQCGYRFRTFVSGGDESFEVSLRPLSEVSPNLRKTKYARLYE
jgi:transcriptional regulator NrdR family protein